MDEHSQHKNHSTWTPWILGGIGAISAITLAPYILPALGLGAPINSHTGHMLMHRVGMVDPTTPTLLGSGLAGSLQTALSEVPLIGSALTSTQTVNVMGASITAGVLTTALAAGVIGIGGMWLADWMEKRETGADKIRWSQVIRFVAITTSILISLPTLLSGISIGLTFVASLFGGEAAYHMTGAMRDSLGAVAMQQGAQGGNVGGLVALIPHLFSCGVAALPVLGTLLMGQKPKAQSTTEPHINTSTRNLPTGMRNFSIALRHHETGAALTPQDIQTTHTQKLHSMVVNRSLTDYHHLHPQFNAATGAWDITFSPRTNEPYRAWHEFTLYGNDAPTQLQTDLPSEKVTRSADPVIIHQTHAQSGGVALHCSNDKPLRAGAENILKLEISDAVGNPVTNFNPIMGAEAHLVGFSKDGNSMIHCHPIARNGNTLQFHVAPKQEGFTQFFLQIQPQNSALTTIPFGQYVAPAQRYTERTTRASQQHHSFAFVS